MAFRKRNISLSTGRTPKTEKAVETSLPGVRPSPLTSHPTTSTGTASLDGLLGGHSGLALGSSLLIEESGSTDFAGALLRFYAAEGICQGHVIHVVGAGDGWVRELPGVAEEKASRRVVKKDDADEKMRIAWRYEKLGQAGERALPDRSTPSHQSGSTQQERPFTHTFDLTKRLPIPQDARINHIPIPHTSPKPFDSILTALTSSLKVTASNTVHRLIIPTLLSPALWPPQSSRPESILVFLTSLRALLRQYPTRLTAMATVPLSLHPRSTGLVRWAEILSDGVLELTPFPHLMDFSHLQNTTSGSGGEDQPQGILRVHRLPISTERGEGGAGLGNSLGEDLAFTVSRRKFVIKPFSLPPLEGDQEVQGGGGAKDVDF